MPALDLVVVATTTNAIPYEVPIDQQQNPLSIIETVIVAAATGPIALANGTLQNSVQRTGIIPHLPAYGVPLAA